MSVYDFVVDGSGLGSGVVEDLGVASVDAEAEVKRLSEVKFVHCLFLYTGLYASRLVKGIA